MNKKEKRFAWVLFLLGCQMTLTGMVIGFRNQNVFAQQVESSEARAAYQGMWVYSWGEGFLNEAQTDEMLQVARDNNINVVFPEIRKTGDAYYRSAIEPRATNIDDGYEDPLADMLSKAHDVSDGKALVEMHAWIVPYRVWRERLGTLPEGHVLLEHPDWVTRDFAGEDSKDILDPGVPDVSDYLVDVLVELVKEYDIDGLHFDYIRYFGKQWGYNPVSVARFKRIHNKTKLPEPSDPLWSEFRREQIRALARKTYARVKQIKWQVKISAAVVGFLPAPRNGDFTQTRPYYDVFQDWPSMMQEGSLDLLCQMNYKREFVPAQKEGFRTWSRFAAEHKTDRHAIIGMGSYLNSMEDNIVQIQYVQAQADLDGSAIYRYGGSCKENNEKASWESIRSKAYNVRRQIPKADWLTQPEFGIVCGVVKDASGQPLDSVAVSLAGETPREVLTDGTGFYAFLKVPSGKGHPLAVTYNGETQSASFDVQAGKVTENNILLQPQKPGRKPVNAKK